MIDIFILIALLIAIALLYLNLSLNKPRVPKDDEINDEELNELNNIESLISTNNAQYFYHHISKEQYEANKQMYLKQLDELERRNQNV